MQRKLTVQLSLEEVREAVKEYVQKHSGDKPVSISLEVSKLNEVLCFVDCEVPSKKTRKRKSHLMETIEETMEDFKKIGLFPDGVDLL